MRGRDILVDGFDFKRKIGDICYGSGEKWLYVWKYKIWSYLFYFLFYMFLGFF